MRFTTGFLKETLACEACVLWLGKFDALLGVHSDASEVGDRHTLLRLRVVEWMELVVHFRCRYFMLGRWLVSDQVLGHTSFHSKSCKWCYKELPNKEKGIKETTTVT